jgi:tetratricopeptide (TPR) repeat protein
MGAAASGRDGQSTPPPSRLLIGVGLIMLVGCLVAAINGQDVLAGTLAVLGVGVAILAVFAPRIRGAVEMGPSGVKFGDRPTADLATGQAPAESATGRAEIAELVDKIEDLVRRVGETEDRESDEPFPAETRLEVARGMLAQRRWHDAALMLDEYVSVRPEDWDAQFARGAAYANSRAGTDADLSALRAFNEALAFVPRSEAHDWLPRFFGYRGAMLKRLGRYDEAENDLRIARRIATNSDDRNDADYNLAAIYALTGRRNEAIELIKALAGTRFIGGIKSHADDYFDSIKDDPEFIALVGPV